MRSKGRDADSGTRNARDRVHLGRRLADRFSEVAIGAALGFVCYWAAARLGFLSIAPIPEAIPLVVVLAIAIALRLAGWDRLLLIIAAVVLAFYAVVTDTAAFDAPIHALIRRDSLPPAVQAVVVLGTGTTADDLLESGSLDRLIGGLELLRRGLARTLIVTRPVSELHGRRLTGDADRAAITGLDSGITVLMAGDVASTHDEAVRSAAVAAPRGIRRIAVVTAPLHTYRACATFAKVGFEVTCVPAPDRNVSVMTLATSKDRTNAFRQWLHERIGIWVYRRRGWL